MSAFRLLTRLGRNSLRLQVNPRLLCAHTNYVEFSSTILSRQQQIPQKDPIFVTSRYGFNTKGSPDNAGKSVSKASPALADTDIFGDDSKLGLFAKFKMMYKKYWYVLIPVHVVTSIGWFGGFYYLSKSGVDIGSLLETLHFSESIINRLNDSKMGHVAIAYLCYKIATPVRYALTLGGTTVSIKYLVQAGHIKPLPSKREFMQMYEEKMSSSGTHKGPTTKSQKEKEK